MLAMQYSIQLAMNYDTALIRKRVEERINLFENLPGLVHKSYLLCEREKIYAPFYVWADITEARNFVLNDLFHGVIKAFNRPRIRDWMVLNRAYGNRELTPRFAIREIDVIAPEEKLETMFQRELEEQAQWLQNPHLHFHLVAIDTDRWEIMRYTLWSDAAHAQHHGGDCIQTYEVLALSEPPHTSPLMSDPTRMVID